MNYSDLKEKYSKLQGWVEAVVKIIAEEFADVQVAGAWPAEFRGELDAVDADVPPALLKYTRDG